MIRMILCALWLVDFLLWSIVLFPIMWILGKVSPRTKDRLAFHVIRIAFRIVLFLAGTKLEVRGKENLPKKGESVLYVANHRSYFDMLVAYVSVPDVTGFVSKIEFARFPVFRRWMKWIRCIFLDRNDIRKGLQTILEGIEQIKGGVSMWLSPEGTRSKNADYTDLLEFKAGGFKLAEKSNATVIPVAMTGTREIYELNHRAVKPSHVILEFGTPIVVADMSREERKGLSERAKNEIRDMLIRQKEERNTPGWK